MLRNAFQQWKKFVHDSKLRKFVVIFLRRWKQYASECAQYETIMIRMLQQKHNDSLQKQMFRKWKRRAMRAKKEKIADNIYAFFVHRKVFCIWKHNFYTRRAEKKRIFNIWKQKTLDSVLLNEENYKALCYLRFRYFRKWCSHTLYSKLFHITAQKHNQLLLEKYFYVWRDRVKRRKQMAVVTNYFRMRRTWIQWKERYKANKADRHHSTKLKHKAFRLLYIHAAIQKQNIEKITYMQFVIQTNILKRVFDIWRAKTFIKMKQHAKIAQIDAFYETKLLRNAFKKWVRAADVTQGRMLALFHYRSRLKATAFWKWKTKFYAHMENKRAQQALLYTTLVYYFNKWRLRLEQKQRYQSMCIYACEKDNERIISKFFMLWVERTRRSIHIKQLGKIAKLKRDKERVYYSFKKWRIWVQYAQKIKLASSIGKNQLLY